MTRPDQPSALRPEILAGRIYTALVAANESGQLRNYANSDKLAAWACDYAAAFLAEWRRRNPDTAERRFEGQDVPEARGLAVEVARGR